MDADPDVHSDEAAPSPTVAGAADDRAARRQAYNDARERTLAAEEAARQRRMEQQMPPIDPTSLPTTDEPTTLQTPRGIATCLLYTSPSPRDKRQSRMPSSA